MYYEINVAFQGGHLFATAPRSITTEEKAEAVWDLFRKKFPKESGYEVTLSYYETSGSTLRTNQ